MFEDEYFCTRVVMVLAGYDVLQIGIFQIFSLGYDSLLGSASSEFTDYEFRIVALAFHSMSYIDVVVMNVCL